MKILIKNSIKILIFVTLPFWLYSQNGSPVLAGARGTAMSDAAVAFTDIHSIFSNQAGLAYLTDFAAVVAGEQRFLAGINMGAAGIAYPTNSGTLGVSIQYFGNKSYSEQKIGLAYGRKLLEKLSIGAQIDYLQTNILEYGSKGIFSFELGLHSIVTSTFHLAAHVAHPLSTKLNETERLPTFFRLGGAYLPTKNVTVNFEVEKDIERKIAFKTGFEYGFSELLFLRLGVRTQPTQLSFGTGISLKNGLRADVAATYHPVLGFTPAVGIVFSPKK